MRTVTASQPMNKSTTLKHPPHVLHVRPFSAGVRGDEESPGLAGAHPPVPGARPPPAADSRRAGRLRRALDPLT